MKKILLNAGHSLKTPGAVNSDGSITEFECTTYACERLFANLYNKYILKLTEKEDDNRFEIGQSAAGYDLFLLIHFNAFDKKRNYCTCGVDSRFVKPTDKTSQLAYKLAKNMALYLQIPTYKGPVWPPGVMPKQLEMTSGAHRVKCPLVVLVEPFFLDYYKDRIQIFNNINIAMDALAESIIREIK